MDVSYHDLDQIGPVDAEYASVRCKCLNGLAWCTPAYILYFLAFVLNSEHLKFCVSVFHGIKADSYRAVHTLNELPA